MTEGSPDLNADALPDLPPDLAEGMQQALAVGDRLKAAGDIAAEAAYWAEGAPDVPVRDLAWPGAAHQAQAARLYRGSRGAPAPFVLYIHGGGWVGGSIALNEPLCRALAAESGWSVLSVSYRLAPDHRYPAALSDIRAAMDWLAREGGALGLDAARMVLAGASAGANLAMAAAFARPGAASGLLLYYGVYDRDFGRESYRRHAGGPGITAARMREIFDLYAPDAGKDPLVVPLHAPDLSGLPASCLIAAGIDVLLDENAAMAARLNAAGVACEFHVEPGVTHGFINRGRHVPAASACLTRGAEFLKRLSGDNE